MEETPVTTQSGKQEGGAGRLFPQTGRQNKPLLPHPSNPEDMSRSRKPGGNSGVHQAKGHQIAMNSGIWSHMKRKRKVKCVASCVLSSEGYRWGELTKLKDREKFVLNTGAWQCNGARTLCKEARTTLHVPRTANTLLCRTRPF